MPFNNRQTILRASAVGGLGSDSLTVSTRHTRVLNVTLDVTAVSGTSPTLNGTLQYVELASGEVVVLDTFTEATGVTTETLTLVVPANVIPDNLVVAWTVGGTDTPTVTFSLGMLEGNEVK